MVLKNRQSKVRLRAKLDIYKCPDILKALLCLQLFSSSLVGFVGEGGDEKLREINRKVGCKQLVGAKAPQCRGPRF